MGCARTVDELDPIGLRLSRFEALELGGHADGMRILDGRREISFVDHVLVPDLPGSELPGADPAPDGFWVPPGPASYFSDVEHHQRYYYTIV
jgi:hypothetical protein